MHPVAEGQGDIATKHIGDHVHRLGGDAGRCGGGESWEDG